MNQVIKPGSQSDELLCLGDMLGRCAAITGQPLSPDAGLDNFNMLPALLGEKRSKALRDHLVMQTNSARMLAIRKGPWKLVPVADGGQGGPQLNNLKADLGETNDLAARHPKIVKELSDLLAQVRQRGRSRP